MTPGIIIGVVVIALIVVAFRFEAAHSVGKMHDRSSMVRMIATVALAAATWSIVLKGSMFALQSIWEAYDAAHAERNYSLSMLLVRLTIFATTTAVTSAVATIVSRRPWMPLLAGTIMLALSIPDHLFPGYVWDEFPVWYHLVYLAYIVPIAYVAGRAAGALRMRQPLSVE